MSQSKPPRTRTASQWARSHPNLMRELGPPDNRLRFTGDQITVIKTDEDGNIKTDEDGNEEFGATVGAQEIRAMLANDILDRIEKGIYRINEGAYEAAKNRWENANTLPCGHTGFSNLGRGRFTCGFELCDERFDRETIAEVFG